MADSIYAGAPYYDLFNKIVRSEVAVELEQMAEHPSMSADMQWALKHAARMITNKE
jgi:hypothetical protein